jgi:stage V sporulation protein G
VEITEVRIKLMDEPGERLQAFCSITFDDCFVIRDLKIIEGSNGPFVAMPSRKLTFHCAECNTKNHLRANYCNQCGAQLRDEPLSRDTEGRAKLYADIAHPINPDCRDMIQRRVIDEFHTEQDRARLPGYVSRYDDIDLDTPARPARRESTDRREKRESQGSTSNLMQPAAREPRPPHAHPRATTQQEHRRPEPGSSANPEFGAGIF